MSWRAPGCRLVCHCQSSQSCHAGTASPPSTETQSLLFHQVRPSCITCQGSGRSRRVTRDPWPMKEFILVARAPTSHKESVWGTCMQRDYCDGVSLASPGRWQIAERRYPEHLVWIVVAEEHMNCTSQYGSADLLTKFALGKVLESLIQASLPKLFAQV